MTTPPWEHPIPVSILNIRKWSELSSVCTLTGPGWLRATIDATQAFAGGVGTGRVRSCIDSSLVVLDRKPALAQQIVTFARREQRPYLEFRTDIRRPCGPLVGLSSLVVHTLSAKSVSH